MRLLIFVILSCSCLFLSGGWGFFAHEHINHLATYALPSEMFPFYKLNREWLIKWSILPDQRRYVSEQEAPRHYFDADWYLSKGFSFDSLLNYSEARQCYSEDSIHRHGSAPWNLLLKKYQLEKAFRRLDHKAILKYSAEIGHYASDIHVPLHANSNYNGQKTNQDGIHALWESRIPEYFYYEWNCLSSRVRYLDNIEYQIWEVVRESHDLSTQVLEIEKELRTTFSESKIYSYTERGSQVAKVFSKNYARKYQISMDDMVRQRFIRSVEFVAAIWYTAWVDAGQPTLNREKINPSDSSASQLNGIEMIKNILGRSESH